MDDFIAANRLNWDDRAKLHATDTTGAYRHRPRCSPAATACMRSKRARSATSPGMRLIHLQCHIGLDTISLAARGAIATGLDFSAGGDRRRARLRPARRPRRPLRAIRHLRRARGARRDIRDRLCHLGRHQLAPRHFSLGAGRRRRAGARRLPLSRREPSLDTVPGGDRRAHSCRTTTGARRCERPLVFDETTTYTGDARADRQRRNYEWIHPLSDIVDRALGSRARARMAARARIAALPALSR